MTFQMPYEVHYLGNSYSPKLGSHFASSAAPPLLHYWYTPDPLLNLMSSQRIIFPTFRPGCGESAAVTYRDCDFKATKLTKLVSSQMRLGNPQAFALTSNFQISMAGISSLMSEHVLGGGSSSDAREIACNFAKLNVELLSSWGVTCKPGTVFDKERLECVADCILGSEVSTNGENCLPCTPGRFQPVKGASCQNCTPGSFSSQFGSTTCDVCGPGWAAGASGAVNCTACSTGKYSQEPKSSSCNSCMVGKYNSELGKSACVDCPIGKFAPVDGSEECQPCAGKGVTTAWVGAASEEDCLCPPSSYFLNSSNGCFPCMTEYMICQSSFGKNTFLVKEGFMSTLSAPDQIYQCGYLNGCQGTRDPFDPNISDICTGYHTGPACFRCEEGFAARGDRCVSCLGSGEGSEGLWIEFYVIIPPMDFQLDIVLGVVFLLLLCTELYDISIRIPTAERLIWGMMIGFVQGVMILGSYNIDWPPKVNALFQLAGIFEFNFDIIGLRMDCFTGFTFQKKLIGRLIWPLLIQLGFVFIFIIWRLLFKVYGHGSKSHARCCSTEFVLRCVPRCLKEAMSKHLGLYWPMSADNILNCMQRTHYGLFISVLATSFSMFNCMEHPNGTMTVNNFSNVVCGDQEWWDAFPIGLGSVLLYCVGFASWVIYLVKVAPQRAARDKSFHVRYRFIWSNWHPAKWWFCLFQLGYAVILNMTSILGANAYQQVYFASTLLTVYMIIVNNLKPWKFISNTILDCCMKFALGLMCTFATVYVVTTVNEEETTLVRNHLENVLLGIAFCPLVIGIAFLFFVVWRKYFASQETHVESILFAQQFRDVMSIATHLSCSDFNKLIHCLADNDRIQLLGAMEVLIAEVLKLQPGPKFKQRRIIPGSPFTVADGDLIEKGLEAIGVHNSPAMLERRLLKSVAARIVQQATKNFRDKRDSAMSRSSLSSGVGNVYAQLFEDLDCNGDGKLSQTEFVDACYRILNASPRGKDSHQACEPDFDMNGNDKLGDDEFIKVFGIVDIDDSGEVSVTEFCAVLRAMVEESRTKESSKGNDSSSGKVYPLEFSPVVISDTADKNLNMPGSAHGG
eukprot:gnl/MRDRNA2_/MRDRNA2_66242_c0_seq1.p1 gnl/MRDRNA2_/MRDRNA2_66242_c0~~gnl/MRDRNA2_/MRDRNA2_66242_c0_seq1.p1  ORF type:complete len:1225 (+),score=131.45 gnl/MRDRNA2_/MRDRNA2_66242_c0_seq1:442-3675(+)